MRRLLSTGASRAWLGVAFAGIVVLLLVAVLGLSSRMGAGQRVIDEAKPAVDQTRIAGTRAGVELLSKYVDVIDPLLTGRGGGSRDAASLIGFMRRKLGISSAQARRILRREAPHTEALTRALPLSAIDDEVARLTSYLASTMGMTEEQVGATLEQGYPRISQSLTALRNTSDAWYDVPGIDGLTRVSRGKPVRTVPGLRKYYRDDLVPPIAEHSQDLRRLAAFYGVGYIPYLLMVAGLGLLALGLMNARRAVRLAPGKLSWALVMGTGVVLLLVVAAAQYVPRLAGAQRAIADLEPVFSPERVRAAANGTDSVHEAITFGDAVMTASGGAAREAPQLYRFVATRTGRSAKFVRQEIRRRAPRLTALLAAAPLTAVSAESRHLIAYLSRALALPGDRLTDALRERAPGLTQALLTVPEVTVSWDAVGPAGMTRFDGLTPVRTMAEFDDYLRQDLVPVLTTEHEDFDSFASDRPPIDALAPALLVLGVALVLYGGLMARLVARRS